MTTKSKNRTQNELLTILKQSIMIVSHFLYILKAVKYQETAGISVEK